MKIDLPMKVLQLEASAISQALDAVMGATFSRFCLSLTTLRASGNKLVVTGVGKSAIAARKISATMATVNIPAVFVDPIGLYHGELGVIVPGDLVLMVSHSGRTEELTRLVKPVTDAGGEIFTLVSIAGSPLGEIDNAIVTGIDYEAFSMIPTCSSAAAVAVGDAAACTAAQMCGYDDRQLTAVHPGGTIGEKMREQ